MNARKGRLTPASPPKTSRDKELEHFVLWARDGSRIAEIEVPSFRPRVEVLLWEGRSFLWHEKTRRYVEAVSFVVKNGERKNRPNGNRKELKACFNSILVNLTIECTYDAEDSYPKPDSS